MLKSSPRGHGPGPRTQSRHAAYRPDIDGLRAVAVLPVVAFHAGIHAVRGGFVGVDVFFVISGYLITQLLYREIQDGRFSILAFYERRIRRILPALLAMLAVTFLLGLKFCLPAEMVELSKSLIAAALSSSNVYFWSVSGYFDSPAASKPLLHTWSLAVEEQFYIAWPLFLLVGHRFFGRRLVPITLVVSAASLIASIVGAFKFPDATFYLPFTRVWELAIGGMLALGAVPVVLGPVMRNLLAAAGLALITGSVFLIGTDMPFPGLFAVPPCLGAAFVILAGRDGDTLAGRFLSVRPVAFIGAISYSLYLWHWPILVFHKNYAFLTAGLAERNDKLLVISLSLLAGALSWKFIEQPFRTGKRRPSDRRLLQMAAVGTAAVVVMGILPWAAGGFPSRYTARELQFASFVEYNTDAEFRTGRCFLTGTPKEWRFADECLAVSSSKKNYLLFGDSHAAELWIGLEEVAKDKHFLQATSSDCFPTLTHGIGEWSKCTAVLDDVMNGFLLRQPVDKVFLMARWKFDLLDRVGETLDWMTQHRVPVTLVGPTPVFESPLPRLLVSSLRQSDPELPYRHLDESLRDLDAAMSAMAKAHGVAYLSMIEVMCPQRRCTLFDSQGQPLIFDREHLTIGGSKTVAERLLAVADIW